METAMRRALAARPARWLVAVTLALAMMLALANVNVATAQPVQVVGTFTQTSFVTANERAVGDLTLFDFLEETALTGTATGTSMTAGTCALHPSGHAACLALETLSGVIDGEVGTVQFQNVAVLDTTTDTIHGAFTVVEGSGTGGLEGLSGHGSFAGQGGSGTYMASLEFGS